MRKLWVIFFWMLLILWVDAIAQGESDKKLTIAVLELDYAGITQDEARILTNRLRHELFQTGEFQVVERSRMEEILKEQSFQLSGCTSTECLVEVGRLIGVQGMVGGSVGKIGNLYTVNIQLIDVETGEIIRTAIEDYRGTPEGLLTEGLRRVALKIAGKPVEKELVEQRKQETEQQHRAGKVLQERINDRRKQTQQIPAKRDVIAARLPRWQVGFGFARMDVYVRRFLPNAPDPYDVQHIVPGGYFHIKYHMNLRSSIMIGIATGTKGVGEFSGRDGFLEVNSTTFMMEYEHRLFKRFISLGIGIATTSSEEKFDLSVNNRKVNSVGLSGSLGIHIPVWKRLVTEIYFHGNGGNDTHMSSVTFGFGVIL